MSGDAAGILIVAGHTAIFPLAEFRELYRGALPGADRTGETADGVIERRAARFGEKDRGGWRATIAWICRP